MTDLVRFEGPPADALWETWDNVHEQSLKLASMITESTAQNGEQYDAMLVIPRGSYYPANILSRELNFTAVNLIHACVSSYAGANRSTEFRYGQMPTPEDVAGKDILIIEEVCDTGHTLKHVTELLKVAGAGLVRTGVLHYKPSKSETDFVPDWWVNETDKWIVYPWEQHEINGQNSTVRRK